MGGAMYATRNARVALNNQLVFMRTQRADGALPGQVSGGAAGQNKLAPSFGAIQGLFFASPAVDMAWYLERGGETGGISPVLGASAAPAPAANATPAAPAAPASTAAARAGSNDRDAYLEELAGVLEGYDRWLWNTRNTTAVCHPRSIACQASGSAHPGGRADRPTGDPYSGCCQGDPARTPHRGLLWTIGVGDSGEDSSTRFCVVANATAYAPCIQSYSFPIMSMGVTSYSYACRASRARIARLLGDGGYSLRCRLMLHTSTHTRHTRHTRHTHHTRHTRAHTHTPHTLGSRRTVLRSPFFVLPPLLGVAAHSARAVPHTCIAVSPNYACLQILLL